MTNPEQPPPARERVLLAAGTATYQHGASFTGGLSDLNAVPAALETVVGALAGLGYSPASGPGTRFLLDPEVEDLKDAIEAAASEAPLVVVYYTGHGLKPERGSFYLLTADSQEDRLHRTALKAEEILDLALRHDQGVFGGGQPQVLVILDCCYSGAGGIETLEASLRELGNPNVWVLASAGSREWGQQGRFAQAFANALNNAPIGHSQLYIHPEEIRTQINKALEETQADQRASLFPPRGVLTGTPPRFFRNPSPIAGVPGLSVDDQVWIGRLRAAPDEATTANGFYVAGTTGRIRAVQDLANWMRSTDDRNLAVLTGSPGTGKSTLLALPALLADRNRSAALLASSPPNALLARAAELFAGLPVFGVYARGLSPHEVTQAIAGYLGRDARRPDDLVIDLGENPETTPSTLIIDAVDEALEPGRLITDLVLPLSRCPRIKVLVGTRRHLLHQLVVDSLMIDLDTDSYSDPQALTDYVRQLLLATHEPEADSPYRVADEDLTATVARAIAARATAPSTGGQEESFLLAQLLARAARSRGQVPDVSRPGWVEQLPADAGGAFDEDLARLDGNENRSRVLLTALAWAKGPGLPWESIWVPVARALAGNGRTKDQSLGSRDVRWLLQNVGRYVVEDLGPGQRSAFRPFHDLLAAHLRGEPARERLLTEPAAANAWHDRSQQVETVITEALLRTVPIRADGHRDWELAHPYLRTYLAQHAHAAGPDTFALLIGDMDYLAVADPATLTALLVPTDPALRVSARAYRRARPLLENNVNDNAAYLQEAFTAETGDVPTTQHIDPAYGTLMALASRDDSLLTLTGHTRWVTSVAFATDGDGELLLASAGSDGTVRLWNPFTGTSVGSPLTGHAGWVESVAFGSGPDGRVLLASSGRDGTVRLWDPLAGTEVDTPLIRHPGRVTSVAFGMGREGALLLASAGTDGTVRLWDPISAAPLGKFLTDHPGRVRSVAFGTCPDGQLLLASASSNGTVRIWDPFTRAPAAVPLTGHRGGVESVAFGSSSDGRLLLASGGSDGTVRIWNPLSGDPVGHPLTGHTGRVESVAFSTSLDGRLILASAGDDGTVRVWDPSTGTPEGEPLRGHPGHATSVATATGPGGRLLLASAGSDGTVRLWEPAVGTRAIARIGCHTGRVRSVAYGVGREACLMLASAGDDGTVRLWDPRTGNSACDPLVGHTGRVRSVVFGNTQDGRLLLASSGNDGTVRLWNPVTGVPVGEPLTGHTGRIRCVAFGNTQDGHLLLASAGNDGTVRLWNPVAHAQIGNALTGHTGRVVSVAFGKTADGVMLLASAGDDGTVRLWDPIAGTSVGEPLTGHTGWVESVAFGTGPDGRLLLVSAGDDRTARLWDPLAGTMLATVHRRTPVTTVALEGTALALAGYEGAAVVEVPYRTR